MTFFSVNLNQTRLHKQQCNTKLSTNHRYHSSFFNIRAQADVINTDPSHRWRSRKPASYFALDLINLNLIWCECGAYIQFTIFLFYREIILIKCFHQGNYERKEIITLRFYHHTFTTFCCSVVVSCCCCYKLPLFGTIDSGQWTVEPAQPATAVK